MRRAAVLTRIVAVACFVLSVPFGPGASVRLFVAVALAFAWISAYAATCGVAEQEPSAGPFLRTGHERRPIPLNPPSFVDLCGATNPGHANDG